MTGRRALAAGVGVAAFAGLLAACGSGTRETALEQEVATNRLAGCLQEFGMDAARIRVLPPSRQRAVIDDFLGRDVRTAGELRAFFRAVDESLSDDGSKEAPTKAGASKRGPGSRPAVAGGDDTPSATVRSFLRCLGLEPEDAQELSAPAWTSGRAPVMLTRPS